MKYKGKGVEGSENPVPISAVSAIFEEDVLLEDITAEDDEEDDDEEDDDEGDDDEGDDDEEDDDEEKVFSASSHSDDDGNDDDDDQGGTGVTVTEASKEQNVDDLMHDDANEDHDDDAESEGEQVNDENVDKVEKLILRLEPDVEEGEYRHTYTMTDIKEMTPMVDPDFKFNFEEELNAFDINQQPEYEYTYVEEADVYDRVEVEDCTDEENVNEDTSEFPTLVEFFSEENRDELRRKVAEILKDKNFDGTTKDPQKEERKKWFRKDTERKFKRPLKFYKRDRDVSLGDIISWGFLPHVNAYAIRREYEELSKGINAENKWNSKWRKIEEEKKLKREKEWKAQEDKDNMLRHTLNQRMAAKEKQAVEPNEKLRKMLARKPKQREETFKSL
ncbi:stress response protein nst1-like [Helianthus annuus]|uniref:stress response protein nst1-like n=1 Tax=Helianthus annuus TaxID=4232 RepID=UPI0016533F90|nr:stress response protein nst1-like [Helianthus annuus]